jgi:hypothetical protein
LYFNVHSSLFDLIISIIKLEKAKKSFPLLAEEIDIVGLAYDTFSDSPQLEWNKSEHEVDILLQRKSRVHSFTFFGFDSDGKTKK